MGVWPFSRNSSHKEIQNDTDVLPAAEIMNNAGTQRDREVHNGKESSPARKQTGNGSRGGRRQARESKKLQRDPEKRTYSFSPGRNDSIRVPKDAHRQHPVPPLPNKDSIRDVQNANAGVTSEKSEAGQGRAHTGVRDDGQDWQRVPTLHKRSAQDLPRRKSSKKRKEDHDREAEIKAMSGQMPTRAATTPDVAGRPMRKETKKLRGLNRIFTNATSDVSLPLQDSIHSSLTSTSEKHASYELKGIDLFSPHPTIRYSENPRYASGLNGPILERPDSRKKKISDRVPIPEDTLKSHKRIEDLADDLDAGDLRELMERDQRRRERKKASDQRKMERKLARRAEKQRLAELEAAKNGSSPPENMERGVFGRELMGLGIGTAAASYIKRKASDASSRRRGKRPAEVSREDSMTSAQNPFHDFHRSSSLPGTEAESPVDEQDEPVIGTAQVARLSRASMSPPSSPKGHTRGASSISQMLDLSRANEVVSTPNKKPEPKRKSSETSDRHQQSWTSFFKRGTKNKRATTPSSFSNTSRDSMPVNQPPPVTYAPPRTSTSGVPKRTMSKFREDLPELPLSPPDSRVQSPEADVVPPIRTGYPEKKLGGRASSDNPFADPPSSMRYDTPTSGYRSLEPASRLRNETPTSGHRSADIPSPEPTAVMSQSLASIDSEGSWLSGRPRAGSKRGSAQLPHPLQDSASSLHNRYKEYSESAEELGIAEDEYFSRLTPGAEDGYDRQRPRRASGNPMPSSDEEDGDSLASPGESQKTKWGAVGRQATVVHRETRVKSREGLLNEYNDDSGSEAPGETPQDLSGERYYDSDSAEKPNDNAIQRATSVDYGKAHVRHISAGSARLLDLKPRASGESKRISTD